MKPKTASKSETYCPDGDTWAYDMYGRMRRSRDRAWVFTGISGAFALMAMAALLLLLPLKQTEVRFLKLEEGKPPVPVDDKYEELKVNEAVAKANIFSFVRAREIVHPIDYKQRSREVSLKSTESVMKEYARLYDKSQPGNYIDRFMPDKTRLVHITSIQLVPGTTEPNTATVRFRADTMVDGKEKDGEMWIATLAYQYMPRPMTQEELLINPLGFIVTDYYLTREYEGVN